MWHLAMICDSHYPKDKQQATTSNSTTQPTRDISSSFLDKLVSLVSNPVKSLGGSEFWTSVSSRLASFFFHLIQSRWVAELLVQKTFGNHHPTYQWRVSLPQLSAFIRAGVFHCDTVLEWSKSFLWYLIYDDNAPPSLCNSLCPFHFSDTHLSVAPTHVSVSVRHTFEYPWGEGGGR